MSEEAINHSINNRYLFVHTSPLGQILSELPSYPKYFLSEKGEAISGVTIVIMAYGCRRSYGCLMGEYNIDYRVITGKYIRWVPTEKHKTNYGMGEYNDKSDRGIVLE